MRGQFSFGMKVLLTIALCVVIIIFWFLFFASDVIAGFREGVTDGLKELAKGLTFGLFD